MQIRDFFHIQASMRKKRNLIFSMNIEGSITDDLHLIKSHVTHYYKDLLGSTTTRLVSIQPHLWDNSEILTLDQRTSLERPFTLEEISKTVFSCNALKAPRRLDQMAFHFSFIYQHF